MCLRPPSRGQIFMFDYDSLDINFIRLEGSLQWEENRDITPICTSVIVISSYWLLNKSFTNSPSQNYGLEHLSMCFRSLPLTNLQGSLSVESHAGTL